jgi:hypothetical protein
VDGVGVGPAAAVVGALPGADGAGAATDGPATDGPGAGLAGGVEVATPGGS